MAPSQTATKAPKRYKIPLVCLGVPDRKGNTVRQRYVPLYELPLIEKINEGAFQPGDEVAVSEVPERLPKDMKYRYGTRAEEEGRLREIYAEHPITKEPVFTAIFPMGRFRETYAQVVEGKWTVEDVLLERAQLSGEADDDELDAETEDDLDAEVAQDDTVEAGREEQHEANMDDDRRKSAIYQLKKLKGVGRDKAGAIYDMCGFACVEDIAECEPEDLEPVPGFSLNSAKALKKQALEMTLGQEEDQSQGGAEDDDPEE